MYKYTSELLTDQLDRQSCPILQWTCTGEIIDRREELKIKIKSLAAEAQIIRQQERKSFGAIQASLHKHRTTVVRKESRSTLLAYGFIRGKTLTEMEPFFYMRQGKNNKMIEPHDWNSIARMCKRYGPVGYNGPPMLANAILQA